jgi:leucyl/phenylalanyl-tRNA---protein transferase
MAIERFPPIETADEDGLLAFGGDLEPESLLLAYSSGIFPWPLEESVVAWFAPPTRAVIVLDEFHVSRKLSRALKKSPFEHQMDHDFMGVITRCAEVKNRGTQGGTWITPSVIEAYGELFRLGHCHSFESYRNGVLVGGLYGIQIGRFFAAESSFYREPGASKAAMCFMVEYLRDQGISWFDCQVLTPFSESFGAREISREEYMGWLAEAIKGSQD